MGTLVFFHKAGRELETISEARKQPADASTKRISERAHWPWWILGKALSRSRGGPAAFEALHNGLEAMDMGVLPDEALRRTLWCLLQSAGFGPFMDESVAPKQAAFDPEGGNSF